MLGFAVSTAIALALVYPLGVSLRSLYSRSVAMKVATAMAAERVGKGDIPGTILATRVYYVGADLTIDIKALLPESERASMRDRARTYQQRIVAALGESVQVNVEAIVAPIERFAVGSASE